MRDYGARVPPWFLYRLVRGLFFLLERLVRALVPPPMRMMQMTLSFTLCRMLFALSEMGVPDILGSEALTAEQIASRVQGPGPVNPELLGRVLNALVGMGAFTVSVRHGRALYSNNSLSELLRSDHPNSMKAMLAHQMLDCMDCWNSLEDMLRGQVAKAWDRSKQAQALGPPGPGNTLWAWLKTAPERLSTFNKAMGCIDFLGAEAMVADGPFGGARRVVDLGGGEGHFLRRILRRHRGATGVLFDRPTVIEEARGLWGPDGAYADLSSRVQLCAGSFFEAKTIPALADGDALVLRYVLHDWSDDDAVRILRTLRQAVSTSRVPLLICECAVPDTPLPVCPPTCRVADVHMMCVFGAAERTPRMWAALFEQSGWRLAAVHPVRGITHWVQADPA